MKRKVRGGYRSLPAIALLALVAPLGAEGCGGGGEDAEAALTKAQFQHRANVICNKAGIEQFEKGGRYLAAHPGADESDAVKSAILPPLEKQLGELEALPVPVSYEDQIESYLAALEKGIEAGREDPDGLLQRENNPFAKANALGKKYQLGDCGVSP
jgi:hypothetical protein